MVSSKQHWQNPMVFKSFIFYYFGVIFVLDIVVVVIVTVSHTYTNCNKQYFKISYLDFEQGTPEYLINDYLFLFIIIF